MVSKRMFFAITVVMAIVFCLFQFSGAAKEGSNEYSTNRSGADSATDLTSQDQAEKAGDLIILIGSPETPGVGTTVKQWAAYTGRRLESHGSLSDFAVSGDKPKLVLLDADYVEWETEAGILEGLMDQGINLVFCSLPDPKVILQSEALMDLFGILSSSAIQVELSGMRLFSGFLLGGTAEYEAHTNEEQKRQDLDLSVPWYVTGSGTKVYLSGMLSGEEYPDVKNEELPSIIWRNSNGSAQAYMVNGDYLSDSRGIGILSAFVYEMNDYDVYPVINANSLSVGSYPVLAEENTQRMEELYSRTSTAFFRDVVWSSVNALSSRLGIKPTYLFTPQVSYGQGFSPSEQQLEYYFRLIGEQHTEVGLWGKNRSGLHVGEKFNEDGLFLEEHLPEYRFNACYLEQGAEVGEVMETSLGQNVRTIVRDFEKNSPLVSYESETVTGMRSISDGKSHTYTQDLMLKSVETALGYSSVLMDMEAVLYPEGEQDQWENYFKDVSSNLSTYWRPFRAFDWTTLSQSDKRIREYLALSCEKKRDGDTVNVQLSGFQGEAFLILRTHGESISSIEGASYEKIEEGAYLLRAESSRIVICLTENKKPKYREN